MGMWKIDAIEFRPIKSDGEKYLWREGSYSRANQHFLESILREWYPREIRFMEKKNILVISWSLYQWCDEIPYEITMWEDGCITHPTIYTDAHFKKLKIRNEKL